MKKIIIGMLCGTAVLALTGCGTTKAAAGAAAGEKGPLCIYNFEDPIDDGDIPDASGNQLPGYTSGEGLVTDGKYGKAMVFNGSDDYISLDETVFDSDSFTFAAWVKPDSWRDWARILDIGDGSTGDLWLGYSGSEHQLRFDVFGPNGTAVTLLAPAPAAGKWTHVAVTLGEGKACLFVNGNLIQQVPCTNKLSGFAHGNAYVGRSNWSADPLFMGAVDDIYISSTCLSVSQIGAVMKGAK